MEKTREVFEKGEATKRRDSLQKSEEAEQGLPGGNGRTEAWEKGLADLGCKERKNLPIPRNLKLSAYKNIKGGTLRSSLWELGESGWSTRELEYPREEKKHFQRERKDFRRDTFEGRCQSIR